MGNYNLLKHLFRNAEFTKNQEGTSTKNRRPYAIAPLLWKLGLCDGAATAITDKQNKFRHAGQNQSQHTQH